MEKEMSKVKKAKRLRRPNIPMAAGMTTAVGGGLEVSQEVLPGRSEPAQANFDYSHIKKDLARIGVLAGSFIAILVVLSFFVK
jgi:hypothetical protein